MENTKVIKMEQSKDLAKKFARNKAGKVVGDAGGTATMNDRVLPIKNFKDVIEHDKIYLGTLQSLQAHLTLYERKLKARLMPLRNKEAEVIKNIKDFVELDRISIEMFKIRGKIQAHNTLINDKIFHYENIALPQFEKECKDMENGEFEKYFAKAGTIANAIEIVKTDDSEKLEQIKGEISDELYWWKKLDTELHTDKEYMLVLFKAIKRLVNTYDKLKDKKDA